MPYLPSAVLIVSGVVLLGYSVVGLSRRVARARSVLGATRVAVGDRAGLLKARSAALRVAVAGRSVSAGRVRSTERGETGGRQ